MARERSGSPVERYVAANLPGGTVVFFHADARAAFADIVHAKDTPAIYATHRRLPVVNVLQRDASVLTHDNLTIVHTHGGLGLPPNVRADAVVIRLPTEKLAFHQLLRDAIALMHDGGSCLVFGGNDEGIKSAAKTMQSVLGDVHTLAHSGGHRLLRSRVSAATINTAAHEALAAPYHVAGHFREHTDVVRDEPLRWFSRPGVFSWDHLDEATQILAREMQIDASSHVLDLGCGAGLLGAVASRLAPDGAVTLLDADSESVRCAQRTMQHSGAGNWRVLASDVTSAVQNEQFDVVVCNPPFHTGKRTDIGLPIRFIEESAAALRPGGRLQLVANRTLPYEAELERVFGNRHTMHDGNRFKVLEAIKR